MIDLAPWDLAGRVAGLPVHHLLGGARDKIKAYASTFNNLGSPAEYAAFAVECKSLGYKRCRSTPTTTGTRLPGRPLLLVPPTSNGTSRPATPEHEAVGDEMVLMYNPWGTYNTYADAVQRRHVVEELNFYWYEHPMPEHKVASYIKLAEELDHPDLFTRRSPRAACHPGRLDCPAEPRTSAGSMCCEEASPVQ